MNNLTLETKAATERAISAAAHKLECFQNGVTHCCLADYDRSAVVPTGKGKGKGRRLCSNCKQVVFTVE